MKRPTYKSIRKAAKKSKRAAIKSGIQKYLYLMSLTPEQVKKLSDKFLTEDGCAICIRYMNTENCPFKPGCRAPSWCIPEWGKLKDAHTDEDYHKFITYATKIYLILLEL